MAGISLATKGVLCFGNTTRLYPVERLDVEIMVDDYLFDIEVDDYRFDIQVDDIIMDIKIEDL